MCDTLCFDSGAFINTVEEAQPICEQIRENSPTLLSLSLSGNSYSVDACQEISQALLHCKSLRVLNLSNMFTRRSSTEVPAALTFLGQAMSVIQSIREVDLSDNAIGPLSLPGLQEYFQSNVFHKLETLNLNNTGLGPEGAKMLDEYWLTESSEIVNFHISRNRLGDAGAAKMSRIISRLKRLRNLELKGNSVVDEGFRHLSLALSSVSSTLESLDVSDNNMHKNGAILLSLSLYGMNKLKSLNISDNYPGVVFPAFGLAFSYSEARFDTLDFSHCGLSTTQILHFLEVWGNPARVPGRLNLNGNELGEAGIEQVREKLSDLGFESAQIGPFELWIHFIRQ